MMQNNDPAIRFRLPMSQLKVLLAGFGIILIYIIAIALSFIFQEEINDLIGIDPAKVSIASLMVVTFIPFGIIIWWLFKKVSRYGILTLRKDALLITTIPDEKLVRSYNAKEINFVKLQDNSFHITFKDGYRFNVLNMGMGDGFIEEMVNFMPVFKTFLAKNNVDIKQGKIL